MTDISHWKEILFLIYGEANVNWNKDLFCFVLLYFFDMTLTSWSCLVQILVSIFSSLDGVSVWDDAVWTPAPVRSKTVGTSRSNKISSQDWPGETNCHLSAVAQTEDPWAFSRVAAFIMVMPQELFELSWKQSATEPTDRKNCPMKNYAGTIMNKSSRGTKQCGRWQQQGCPSVCLFIL